MIDGDETTLKSILEEKNELKQKLGSKIGSSDESELDDMIRQNYPRTEVVRGKGNFNDNSDNEAFEKIKKRKKKMHSKILKQKIKK